MYYPILFIILFVLVGVPVVLTLMNIILLFSEKKFKAMTVNLIDLTIFALGILYTVFCSSYEKYRVRVCKNNCRHKL